MPRAPTGETTKLRRVWDKQAPRYDRQMQLYERVFFGVGRAWVCARASGNVLEVAVGTGRNFPFYPAGGRIAAIDLSPAMLRIARWRARQLGLDVDVLEGDAETLPSPDESFDTVVGTLSLCAMPDDRRAVVEMKRVLRPGGRLLLLDYVPSSVPLVRGVQRLLELVTVRFGWFGGVYQLRRPLVHVRAEGFHVERRERSKLGIVERLSARKPARL